ncbi:cell surface glycoprotein CD200 receptor 1-A-like isoform X5 [Emydura macquarii macquarii]|uniref:cell surface glycoprotein CD200 receptor 1-A-like isoform X5 n=1 Tax=Emydura macquarii macquarii TaxID=1129001 RepID=UPI00352B7AEB
MIPGHHNYRHLVQFVLITSQDMAQVWLVLAELLLFLIKVVQGPVDSTVSAVVGTSAVVRCPNTAMSSLILVVWKIRPKNGTRCTLAYRADTNKTGGINCSERVTWDSSPNHEAALQIHPVRLTDEGIYICEIGTSDGTFCQVSALTVLASRLSGLADDATVPNTNFLRMKSSPLRSIISSQDFLTVFSSLFPFDAAQDNAPVTHLEPRHQPLLDTEKGLGALIPARSQDTEMPSCLIPASIQREGNAQMLPCCLCWRVNLGLIHCLGLCTVVVP